MAVRSSATAEDLEGASFAGQQDTYLNIRGVDAVLDAVRRCWASLWTARAMAYRARQGIDPAEVSLAVVVQELVDAAAAGVMFTADPSTGSRDTVLISAAWGLGEAVVGGLVNTDQLTLVGDRLTVTDRQIADKAVQTVRTDDGTAEVAVPDDRRRAAVLDDAAARDLAALGRRIAQHFGAPQDIEWARSTSGALMIVQSRPITALPAPAGPVPTDWTVPDDGWYFRASIVEQLPDPLTPLFAELIEPAVVNSVTAIMTEVLGEGSVQPGDVGFPTVHGYAYYRYGRAGHEADAPGQSSRPLGRVRPARHEPAAALGDRVPTWLPAPGRRVDRPRSERAVVHRAAGRDRGTGRRRRDLLHGRADHHPDGGDQ